MKLILQRPLAFIDIESTGINRETDRIIELCVCKLNAAGERDARTWLINPGMPIPPESTNIHGITDAKVKGCLHFEDYARTILDWLNGCDIAGFNSNTFDVPMLFKEFGRCGIYWNYTAFKMVDAGNIYKINESRTLAAGYKFYCNGTLANAHSAEADVMATIDIFIAQLEKYELPQTVAELALYSNYGKPLLDLSGKFTYDDKNNILLNFGKHKGQRASEHLDFVQWMTSRDFPPDTLNVCDQLLMTDIRGNDAVDGDGLPF